MFSLGDLVKIYAPSAGYTKYHLCVFVGNADLAYKFLFLNSDPNFADCYKVPCSRVPCIHPSETGFTVFSFSMLPMYTLKQLVLYQAEKIGTLDSTLAAELEVFVHSVKALTRSQKLALTEVFATLK